VVRGGFGAKAPPLAARPSILPNFFAFANFQSSPIGKQTIDLRHASIHVLLDPPLRLMHLCHGNRKLAGVSCAVGPSWTTFALAHRQAQRKLEYAEPDVGLHAVLSAIFSLQ